MSSTFVAWWMLSVILSDDAKVAFSISASDLAPCFISHPIVIVLGKA
jgi:hypothetical protein